MDFFRNAEQQMAELYMEYDERPVFRAVWHERFLMVCM